MSQPPLPIDGLLPDLLATLANHSTVLLQASPGAGKTTRVPLALLDAPWCADGKILMLEPRRLAARTAARFMALQRGESVGQTVGYRTRLDTQVSKYTRVEVVTEGILTRMIQSDPSLEGVSAVIFDEFHERSLNADLGLALVREVRQALREDLRVVVMSATLNTGPIADLLGQVPVLTAEGRAFPVEERYRPAPRSTRLESHACAVIEEALSVEDGSVLVFLPGVAEIRRVERQLSQSLPANASSTIVIAPLYGNLPPQAQDRAIEPAPDGVRKVVLATAIAESSLTIEGIRVVVDAGLQRSARFDPNSGMTRLATRAVSRASAEQRKGRAGRLQSGVCYRLWSESEQFSLAEFTPPEIQEADLAPLVLELAQWGARSADDLEWIDRPPQAHWNQAAELLTWLELLSPEGAITDHGRSAIGLGIHPRLANLVLRGRELGLGRLASELAALLGERDFLGRTAGVDLRQRVAALRAGPNDRPGAGLIKAIRQSADKLTQRGDRTSDSESESEMDSEVGRLLSLAFPDRIARRRPGEAPRYQLSNGRGAALSRDDALAEARWLVAAELDGKATEARIFLAAPVREADLTDTLAGMIETTESADWDNKRGTVVARRRRCLGALVLQETELPRPAPELIRQGLLAEVRKRGLAALPWAERDRQWLARARLLHREFPDAWPDLSDGVLIERLDDWLGPFLAGLGKWSEVQALNLSTALDALLDYDQQQALATQAPATLTIPTGQAVRLDYTADNGPVLAAKLQALFGWQRTPTVANGRRPVVIHLLSPAQRPLAVTADLASFWANVYPEVRKDMRGRYPKHPWPEDPVTAAPQQGVKKKPSA